MAFNFSLCNYFVCITAVILCLSFYIGNCKHIILTNVKKLSLFRIMMTIPLTQKLGIVPKYDLYDRSLREHEMLTSRCVGALLSVVRKLVFARVDP